MSHDGDMTPQERLARLRAAEIAGEPIDLLAFYGHRPDPDGSIGRGCLSQWWPAPFTLDGQTYPTAEHWMMCAKARLFDDAASEAEIMANPEPGAAKALGRLVRGFDDDRWHEVAYGIVVAGNLAKFGQHPELLEFLRRTGRRVLVEASPSDRVWGVGLGRDHPDVERPTRWLGTNLLGFALMEVRETLIDGGSS
jgi:ribA/ribD-fused uncharacterized protein